MLKYLFLLLPLFYKSEKMPQIRIAFIGDSFCAGCCVPYNDSVMDRPLGYRYQIIQWYNNFYDTVIAMRGCSGGENIRNAMPDWYPGRKLGFNIDSALRWGADLIVIQYSGNHFMNGIRLDTVKYCYKYINDTLISLNKKFVFISNQARKVSLGTGNTFDKFQDSVKAINRYIDSLNNYSYLNVFDTTYDPATNKPIWNMLGSDSLHWDSLGYSAFAGAIKVNSPVIDSAAGFDKLKLYNLTYTVVGDSLDISFALLKAKQLTIAISSNGTTYTLISNEFYKEGRVTKRILLQPYVRLLSRRRNNLIMITRHFTL